MRYTRTAQGLLNAQYRSVLKKCLMINLGLFALGANVAGAEDFILKAEDLSTSSSIKWTEIDSSQYDPNDKNMIKVDLSSGKSQYFAYTYTKPEGGTVYDTRQEGKEGALTGDITADFKDSISNVDGGALANAAGNTLNITGDFLHNQVDNTSSGYYGGAIYNKGTLSIKGDMISNHIVRDNGAYGGAIFNESSNANITEIIGNFIGNHAVAEKYNSTYGGAIYNKNGAVIGKIEGKFIGNYLISNYNRTKTYFSGGGAIINWRSKIDNINGVFINNFVKNESGISAVTGGAIDNYDSGAEIGVINADFYNNYAYNKDGLSYGGAINSEPAKDGNDKQSIHKITGNFIGNYTKSVNYQSDGGAISNMQSTIDEIKGNFTNNYALGGGRASGGAINNNRDGIIGSISGDFEGNYAESNGGAAEVRGGALINFGKITNLAANFSNNHALTNGTFAIGGAVLNMYGDANSKGIGTLSGNFSNNFAQTTGADDDAYAQGGAIYNGLLNGGLPVISDIQSSTFSGNYVSGASKKTDGGAVWNAGTIGFSGKTVFKDNYKVVNGVKTANDIYNSGTINVAENGSLDISGGITGDGNGKINLAQNAELNLNNATSADNNLTLEKDATLAFNVNEINTLSTTQKGGKVDGDIKLNADSNLKFSTYVEHGVANGEGTYKFANTVDTANGKWKLNTIIANSLYNYDFRLNDENNTLILEFAKKNADEIAKEFDTSKDKADEILAITSP